MSVEPKLLNQKDLARSLGVSLDFVRAMKFQGFLMPGGRALRADALQWLKTNAATFRPALNRKSKLDKAAT